MTRNSLLNNWRKSATRRAEFAALLQEPCMQEAIAIVKEAIFVPIQPPVELPYTERGAFFAEMGLRREAGLEFLYNFLSLATLHPFKAQAQELQKKKPWHTEDRKAGEDKLLREFYGGTPPPLNSEQKENVNAESSGNSGSPNSEIPQE
jgi:hypothetical protein